jgi:hypothetical protein
MTWTAGDQSLLSAHVRTLNQSLIDDFCRDYSARLSNALATETWAPAEPEQTHIDILRDLTVSDVTSFELDGDVYGTTQSLLALLELTFQYVKIAERIRDMSDMLLAEVLKSVRLFAYSSLDSVLRPERTITGSMLALSAAGLQFCAHLLPLIDL